MYVRSKGTQLTLHQTLDSEVLSSQLVQARSRPILIGQAILYCNTVRVRYAYMSSRGVWGHAPPEKFFKTTHREMQSGVFCT